MGYCKSDVVWGGACIGPSWTGCEESGWRGFLEFLCNQSAVKCKHMVSKEELDNIML